MRIAVLGAGELGSRHLQGLMRTDGQKELFVIDPVQASLDRAMDRAAEMGDVGCISASTEVTKLPDELDLAILAMNADHRLSALRALVGHSSVRHLVLEKVLFQRLSDFDVADRLIAESGATCHVNHPRRMAEPYARLQMALIGAPRVNVNVTGGNWGLGCNALHLLDLIEYVSGSEVATLDTTGLDRVIHEAKRPGFIEFTGTLAGTTAKGSFSISSLYGSDAPLTTTVSTIDTQHVFRTVPGEVVIRERSQQWAEQIEPFRFPFQSELSGRLVEQLMSTGTCELPLYAPSALLHRKFLMAMLAFYNDIKGGHSVRLPIT